MRVESLSYQLSGLQKQVTRQSPLFPPQALSRPSCRRRCGEEARRWPGFPL